MFESVFRGGRGLWRVYALVGLLALPVGGVSAQNTGGGGSSAVTPGGVEVKADRLEYQADKKLLVGVGHVVVRRGDDVLRADCISVHTDTQDAYATGNVEFRKAGRVWHGDELTYNFRTKQGDFGEFTAYVEPYYIRAADSHRISENEFVLRDAVITTCEGPSPDFSIRAGRARITPDDMLKAHNVVVFLGPVPILYLPVWKQHLHRDKTNLDVVPGYSSRMGAFLLTAYNYRINSMLRAATHLDLRTRRGIGVGEDFVWDDPEGQNWNGDLKLYYTHDDKPYEDDEEDEKAEGLVDPDRYRIRLRHYANFSARDYGMLEADYLSDPDMLEDFFNEDFREGAQPENRISLTHRGDLYTARMNINARLNDFYESVERLPELTLEVPRVEVPRTPLYYESDNSAAFLRKVYKESSDKDDYDAFRLDTVHTLYYPTRHFGFLNVIPRAGVLLTYYSKTKDESTVTNSVTVTETNVVGGVTNITTSITNKTDTVIDEGGADLRNQYELGLDLSFKAFRVLVPAPARGDGGLRHIAEPYAKYTYLSRPNLEPDELYQFDSVDRRDKEHYVRLGMRNKLQDKHRGGLRDLVDIDVNTDYRIEKEDAQHDFSNLRYDAELRLVDWLKVDFDGQYDWYESDVPVFNTQVAFLAPDESSLGLEYRYRKDDKNLVSAELNLFPRDRWSFNGYWRYDFDNSNLEEQSYFVQHTTDCLGVGLGFDGRGDDWTVWVRLWLLAFPESMVELGR